MPFRGERSSKKCCLELGGLFQLIHIYIRVFAILHNHKVQEYHTRSWHGKLA